MLFLTKKIFCPTEFSKPARRGVDAAVEMAEKFSTEPILVHVTLAPWRSGSFQRATNKERHTAYAHEAMARLIKESVPSQIKCRSQIIGGMLVRPANAIVQLAEEEAADLIVLASHGQSGWGRIFFGSVAENVVCLSICPVLTLKRPNSI